MLRTTTGKRGAQGRALRQTRLISLYVATSLIATACGTSDGEAIQNDDVNGEETASSASEEDFEERKLTFNAYLPSEHTIWGPMEEMWSALEGDSAGAWDVELYPGEQLGKAADSVSMLQSGVADATFYASVYHPSEIPATQVWSLPHEYNVEQLLSARWAAAHEEGPYVDELKKEGLVPIAVINTPANELSTTGTPLDSLESLQGLQMRSGGDAMTQMLDAHGAIGVEVTTPEMFEALDRGMVDGVVYTFASWESVSVNDLLEHSTRGVEVITTALGIFLDIDVWEEMNEAEQAAVYERGREASIQATTAFLDENDEAFEKFVEDGLEVYEWDDSMLKEFHDPLAGIRDDWAEEIESQGIEGKAALEQVERIAEQQAADTLDLVDSFEAFAF